MTASNVPQSGVEMVEDLKTTSIVYEEPDLARNLLLQLDTLRQTDLLCDVTVVVDGTGFRCHRVVLAAACPYFQALFRHDSDSVRKCELCLEGVSATTFQLILDFMYTSRLCITSETVIELLEAADFLQYRDIVRSCCDILLQHITDDNALSLHQLAVAHMCQPLVEATWDYVLNNFSAISQTKDFLLLPPEIMMNLVSAFRNFVVMPDKNSFASTKNSVFDWASQFCQSYSSEISSDVCSSFSHLQSEYSDCCVPSVAKSSDPNLRIVHECIDLFLDRSKCTEILVAVPGEASAQHEAFNTQKRNIFYYDPFSEKWSVLTELPFYNRIFYAVASHANILYICGGEKMYDMPTRKVYAYSVDRDEWMPAVEPMLKPRSNHSAAVCGGYMYVIGGRGLGHADLWNNGEMYDPKTEQWTLLPSIPHIAGVARCALVPLGGKLYVFGGMESYVSNNVKERRPFTSVWKYDVEQKTWHQCDTFLVHLQENKMSVGLGDCFPWRGFILIIDEDMRGKRMKLFNPVTGKMADFRKSNGHHRFGGYALMNDTLFCTGGIAEYFKCHDLVHCTQLLEPEEWHYFARLPCSLSHHSCLFLSKVLEANDSRE